MEGKVAIVTGSATGVGAATAVYLQKKVVMLSLTTLAPKKKQFPLAN